MKSKDKHMATMADMAKMGKGASSDGGMMKKKPMKKKGHKGHKD